MLGKIQMNCSEAGTHRQLDFGKPRRSYLSLWKLLLLLFNGILKEELKEWAFSHPQSKSATFLLLLGAHVVTGHFNICKCKDESNWTSWGKGREGKAGGSSRMPQGGRGSLERNLEIFFSLHGRVWAALVSSKKACCFCNGVVIIWRLIVLCWKNRQHWRCWERRKL